jgi:Right handed beta helix region
MGSGVPSAGSGFPFLYENNRIYRVDRSGIFGWSTHWMRSKWYPSLSVVIRGNVLDGIGGDGIVVVAADGALVERNVVSRANQCSEGYNAGIWPWSADHTIVQFNEVYGVRGQRDGEGFDSTGTAATPSSNTTTATTTREAFSLSVTTEGRFQPRVPAMAARSRATTSARTTITAGSTSPGR